MIRQQTTEQQQLRAVDLPQQLQGRDQDEHEQGEGQVYEKALKGMVDWA